MTLSYCVLWNFRKFESNLLTTFAHTNNHHMGKFNQITIFILHNISKDYIFTNNLIVLVFLKVKLK